MDTARRAARRAPINEYGAFSGAFGLPPGAALGVYSIDTEVAASRSPWPLRKPEFESRRTFASDVGFGDELTP